VQKPAPRDRGLPFRVRALVTVVTDDRHGSGGRRADGYRVVDSSDHSRENRPRSAKRRCAPAAGSAHRAAHGQGIRLDSRRGLTYPPHASLYSCRYLGPTVSGYALAMAHTLHASTRTRQSRPAEVSAYAKLAGPRVTTAGDATASPASPAKAAAARRVRHGIRTVAAERQSTRR
jgi:hypothetical protein